jgi:hypothetical protein
MMPACPPPAPNPFRAPPASLTRPMPLLWLAARNTNKTPRAGRNWIN